MAIDTRKRFMKRLIIHGDDINDSADEIDKKLDQWADHICVPMI